MFGTLAAAITNGMEDGIAKGHRFERDVTTWTKRPGGSVLIPCTNPGCQCSLVAYSDGGYLARSVVDACPAEHPLTESDLMASDQPILWQELQKPDWEFWMLEGKSAIGSYYITEGGSSPYIVIFYETGSYPYPKPDGLESDDGFLGRAESIEYAKGLCNDHLAKGRPRPKGPRYMHPANGGEAIDLYTASSEVLIAALAGVEKNMEGLVEHLSSLEEHLAKQECDPDSGDLLYDEGLDAQDDVTEMEQIMEQQEKGVQYMRDLIAWRKEREAAGLP